MNTQQLTSTKSFIAHMCKYLGVGLISGSIVHAGTLGGNYIKYTVLIGLGVLLFIIGNILEHGMSSIRELAPYIGISTILSIGTGMVSGGTQHYLDGPFVAAILFPVGFFLAYLSFIYRDYRDEYTLKKVLQIIGLSICIFLVLYMIAQQLPAGVGHGHDEKIELSVTDSLLPLQSDGHRHIHN